MVAPVEVHLGGIHADPHRIPLPLTITHGRGQIGNQPDPPTCTLEWLDPVFPWAVGDDLKVGIATEYKPAVYDSPTVLYDDPDAGYDDNGAGVAPRALFAGTIAGLNAVSGGGQVLGWAVEGVGYLARLAATPVTLTRPTETDAARVQAIAASAGVTITTTGNSTIQLAAADVHGDALSVLHDVCASSGGLLWQTRAGAIRYGTADHREVTTTPAGVLPASGIDHALAWNTAVEQIVNQVTVVWGPDDGRVEAIHTDPASAAEPWGLRAVKVDTQCAGEPDAEKLALMILARRAWPHWGIPEAVVYWPDLPADAQRLLAALDVSTPVLVPFTEAPGPTPSGPVPAIVEGFIETVDVVSTMQVALSDMARWVLMHVRSYTELAADFPTYTDMAAAGSYITAAVKEGA